MTPPEVIVVVPCFNEAHRLPVDSFLSFIRVHSNYSFLFVDDGSGDETFRILSCLKEQEPKCIQLLKLEKNGGKAEAVRQGILKALQSGAPFIGYWDADLATPLEVLPHFLNAFNEQPKVDIVLGARVKLMGRQIERRPLRHYLGRIFATAASLTLNMAVYDTQCGAKLFRGTDILRDVFEKPFCSRWIFDVEILARFMKRTQWTKSEAETHIYELPLRVWRDVAGSKVKPLDFFKAFGELITIYFRNR